MISCGWAKVADLLAEPNMRGLILDYFEELSPMKAVAPLDPDFERMIACEAQGIFRVWAARQGGQVVGLVMLWIMPHLNYRSTLFAFDAGHYLVPDLRDGHRWSGVRMWRGLIDALRELGVKVLLAHDNAQRPLGPFFKRLGFEPRSTNYWLAL